MQLVCSGAPWSKVRDSPRTIAREIGLHGVNAELTEALLDALYPSRCLLCGSADCAAHPLDLDDTHPRCSRCAARLPAILPDGSICNHCRLRPPGFTGAACLGDYADPNLRAWVLALKHGGRTDLAEPLGRALGARLLERGIAQGTPIVPVPLAWLRRHERGHDQALGLARGVAAELESPVVRALKRKRWTAPQGSPSAPSRSANVSGAFVARKAAARLQGLEVLLIDDVATSGATLAECARVLRKAGASRVRPAFIARAGRHTDDG